MQFISPYLLVLMVIDTSVTCNKITERGEVKFEVMWANGSDPVGGCLKPADAVELTGASRGKVAYRVAASGGQASLLAVGGWGSRISISKIIVCYSWVLERSPVDGCKQTNTIHQDMW